MHKTEHQQNTGVGQANTGLTPQAIWKTMNRPEFDAEQLPALWEQAMHPDETRLNSERRDQWIHGIGAMYRRCETYPQHAKLAAILSGMAKSAWRSDEWIMNQADNLLKQATPEQLLQTLTREQQQPGGWWQANDHILTWADIDQLTGQILKQVDWTRRMVVAVDWPEEEITDRWLHIVEQIRQQLLDGDSNAWNMFLGIIEPGHSIGETAEIAKAIEQEHRP